MLRPPSLTARARTMRLESASISPLSSADDRDGAAGREELIRTQCGLVA